MDKHATPKLGIKQRLKYIAHRMFKRRPYWKPLKFDFDRVLTTRDLSLFGLGSTLSFHMWTGLEELVLITGPAVCLSFVFAGLTLMFTVACYAELAAGNPSVGSSFSYCHKALGDYLAFNAGWLLLICYECGTACNTLKISQLIYSELLKVTYSPRNDIQVQELDFTIVIELTDALGVFIVIILTGLVLVKVRYSRLAEDILVMVSLAALHVWLAIAMGSANANYWKIPASGIPKNLNTTSTNSFLPFGVMSIFFTATKCYSDFGNFEIVTTTGSEMLDPMENIPKILYTSVTAVTLLYAFTSMALTLMWPWFDFKYTFGGPLNNVLVKVNLRFLEVLMTLGILCFLLASVFSFLYGQSRILLAMSKRGLMFKCFGTLNETLKLPVWSAIATTVPSALFILILDPPELEVLMRLSKVAVYMLTVISFLVEGYSCTFPLPVVTTPARPIDGSLIKRLMNFPHTLIVPTPETESLSKRLIFIIFFAMMFESFYVVYVLGPQLFGDGMTRASISLSLISLLLALVPCIFLALQPHVRKRKSVVVTCLPIFPLIALNCNTYIFAYVGFEHWLEFVGIIFVGQVVYWRYSIWESTDLDEVIVESEDLDTSVSETAYDP